MASSVLEFWQLVEQSQLLAGDHCHQLHREFQATNGATDHTSPHALAEWLVSRNIFSRYQVTVLLAGRPGPFVYGDYKIYDRVESGRLANQFRAVHAGVGHPVLLRFLAGPVVQDQRLWMSAATEAQIACSISHANLQRFFELVDLGSFKFLVEEDLHGETLAERLSVGRLPPQEACRVARMLAQGLAALHATGRALGDIRPLNVWLEPASMQHPGPAKLLRDPLTSPAPLNFAADDSHGWLLAQSDYLAPEFQMPGKLPDVLTDLYALGCTLYHMLAGHPPFPGGSVMQKMARHSNEAIRPLETYGVPQPLAQLVTFLMAKNPALRYQDAQTVADQLVAFIDPGLAHVPPPPAPPTLPAYEASLRQSQASLSARNVQATFGMPPAPLPPVAQEPEVFSPAPTGVAIGSVPTGSIPTGSVPTGSIPKGKAVGSSAATGPTFPVRGDGAKPEASIVDTTVRDPAFIAAKEARDKRKLITILVSVGVAAIALIIGVNMFARSGKETANTTDVVDPIDEEVEVPAIDEQIGVQTPIVEVPDTPPPDKSPVEKIPVAESGPQFEIVADDGKLPWASPTAGAPIDLKYVPPSAGLYLVVRPADLLATPEGPKVMKALGPNFTALQSQWESSAGVTLGQCEQLIVSLHDNNNQYPRASVVARLKDPVDRNAVVERLGEPVQKTAEGNLYAAAPWTFFVPSGEEGVFLMAADEDARQVPESLSPLLSLEMEQMRRATDADRHVTLLVSPTAFLFSGEGDPLFTGDLVRVKAPLRWLLGENVQAASLSIHLDDIFYTELRAQTKVDMRPDQLASDLQKRLEEVPKSVKSYIVRDLDPPDYWDEFAFDFPAMIKSLHEYSRVGAEGKQAVVNAVLPAAAGHNLVLGTELTLAQAPGPGATTAVAAPSGPKTIEDVMNLKVSSYSFDQKTFEDAIKDIEAEARELMKGAEVDFSMRVMGPELETNGITRNRSIATFKEENKPLGEVLTALCMKNNPDPSTKLPSDPKQLLIWVIGIDPEDAEKKTRVLITTRAAAQKHGFKLPAAFQPK